MEAASSLYRYKGLMLVLSNDESFDLSAFKQTTLMHASYTRSGSSLELPGDLMYEGAANLFKVKYTRLPTSSKRSSGRSSASLQWPVPREPHRLDSTSWD